MEEEVLRKFGNKIRKLRQIHGYTQEELAEKSGLHRNYVGGVERGERNISLLNIVKLAQALDTDATKLVEDID